MKKNNSICRYIALIPAYKPDDKLVNTARELRKNGFSVVVVDDGSGEQFSEIFRAVKKYAPVLSYGENHGKGYALKTGINYIMKKFSGKYTIVTVDADGQHSTEDAMAVAQAAAENPGSLALGYRKLSNDAPLRSRFGNSMTRHVFKILSGTAVYDTQTGLRAFSDDIAPEMLRVKGSRYEYEMNMLMQCAYDGTEIIELPIRTIYIDDNSSSHFNPLKDSFRIYKSLLDFRSERRKNR